MVGTSRRTDWEVSSKEETESGKRAGSPTTSRVTRYALLKRDRTHFPPFDLEFVPPPSLINACAFDKLLPLEMRGCSIDSNRTGPAPRLGQQVRAYMKSFKILDAWDGRCWEKGRLSLANNDRCVVIISQLILCAYIHLLCVSRKSSQTSTSSHVHRAYTHLF